MRGEDKELGGLTDEQLEALFERAGQDERILGALNEELKRRDSDEAIELHLKVVQAFRKARASAASASPASPPSPPPQLLGPVRRWLADFLAVRDLPAPNGRHLYRYRITDSEYENAAQILRQLARSGRLARPDERAARLFVVFCAEWFRRKAISTWRKWDELAPDIFPDVPYPSKQDLTEMGLAYWKRPLIRSDFGREFLLTLALEGGIPVNAIVEGEGGWLKDYLRTIMQRAITHRTLEPADILGIAGDESWRLRQSYRHDDFVALAAELAHRLLQWRKEAEDKAPAMDALLYLDGQHPNWRDGLPIYVPPGDTHARELVSGLLNEKITGLATTGVGARRFLVKTETGWKPAVQMLVDGEVPRSSLAIPISIGNFRAVPTGELANHISGDVALLEPPVGNQRTWRVTPRQNLSRPLIGFPFERPLTVSLTNPGASTSIEWRGGQAVRSELLVFEADSGGETGHTLLRLVRAGSVSAPAERLFVLLPRHWRVMPGADDAIAGDERIPDMESRLVTLTGTAYFENPNDPGGRFRVEPNTQAREAELELAGTRSRLETGIYDLWEAPLSLKVKEGAHTRPAARGELFWRVPGGRWVEVFDKVDARGTVELSWRDPAANIQLEKRRIGIVPPGAHIDGHMTGPQSGEATLQGFTDWEASASEASVTLVREGAGKLLLGFVGRPSYRVSLLLRPPGGDPLDVIVPLAGRDASVVLADGSIAQPGRQLDLGLLRGAIAVSPRRTTLTAGLKGLKTAGLRLEIDGELPLSSLRTGFAEIFAVSGSQDSVVELEFAGDHRLPVRFSRYRQDSLEMEPAGAVRWHATLGDGSAMPVARMLLAPRHEHLLDQVEPRLWKLPERCHGPCLIYLREGQEVISRPLITDAAGGNRAEPNTLLHAITIHDRASRIAAIDHCLHAIGSAQAADDDLTWLLDLVASLNGLPPTALDVLQRLDAVPSALIQLLMSSRDDVERRLIWELQRELPFLWLGLPADDWCLAVQSHYSSLSRKLDMMPDQIRNEIISGEAKRKAGLLIDLERGLAPVLLQAGFPVKAPEQVPLRESMDAYVRRDRGSDDNPGRGIAPGSGLSSKLMGAGMKLPEEVFRLDHESFDGLLAPALLAAGSVRQFAIDKELELLIRRVCREDPGYVSDAFPHFLKFYRAMK